MLINDSIKPKFWNYQDTQTGHTIHIVNFRQVWYTSVFLTSIVALVPLILMAVIDYKATQQNFESEILLRTSRVVSNTRRTISFLLEEQRSFLDFIIHDNKFEELKNPARLAAILENLRKRFGESSDIGLIDSSGIQQNYIGPYDLKDKDYSDQTWYRQVLEKGLFISDVFLGYRKVPHLVIAVKRDLPDGSFFILRAAVGIEQFEKLFSDLKLGGSGDVFIINHYGTLQTPSRYHGKLLENISLPVPKYSSKTEVFESINSDGEHIVIGYRYIEDTPFILMIVKKKHALMKSWQKTRLKLIVFLLLSILLILAVSLGRATYMVNKLFLADEKRTIALHRAEYASKLASIGRLAAGVAHEINNPLAIINEKAGLIKDLFSFKGEYSKDQKLISLVESILVSVERCGKITKRLLRFARHMDVSFQMINIGDLINEVLDFLSKEAEYRSIAVSVKVQDDVPELESDRGKLQQIFLNFINNSFAAMSDGGHLDIAVKRKDLNSISITVTDDGCGIPREALNHIFEPFFSTKTAKGGTGLGLSITYSLIQEIGGSVNVKSEVGKGTTFNIILPINIKKKGRGSNAHITSG